MGNVVLSWLGKRIASYLTKEIPGYEPSTPPDFASLERSIQPGDVLLIEGNTRIASVIKYLTQSTWSHSAMYVGPIDGSATKDGEAHVLVEATPVEGVVSAPLSKYRFSHVRICRAHALTPQDRAAVVRHVTDRIGLSLRQIVTSSTSCGTLFHCRCQLAFAAAPSRWGQAAPRRQSAQR